MPQCRTCVRPADAVDGLCSGCRLDRRFGRAARQETGAGSEKLGPARDSLKPGPAIQAPELTPTEIERRKPIILLERAERPLQLDRRGAFADASGKRRRPGLKALHLREEEREPRTPQRPPADTIPRMKEESMSMKRSRKKPPAVAGIPAMEGKPAATTWQGCHRSEACSHPDHHRGSCNHAALVSQVLGDGDPLTPGVASPGSVAPKELIGTIEQALRSGAGGTCHAVREPAADPPSPSRATADDEIGETAGDMLKDALEAFLTMLRVPVKFFDMADGSRRFLHLATGDIADVLRDGRLIAVDAVRRE